MADRHDRPLHSRFVRVSDSKAGILGRGTFGTVFLCIDIESKCTVAVKIQEIPNGCAARELAMFKMLEIYPHQNIVKMFHHFHSTVGTKHYLNFVVELASTDLWQHWRHPLRQSGLQDI